MDQLEIYLLLFTDTFVSNFAFSNTTELALFSMKIFGVYNPYIVILTASGAIALVYLTNYILGMVCYKILSPMNEEEGRANNSKKIEAIRSNKFLPLILLLSGVPFFGKFIILFAGFCRVRLLLAISIGTFAKLVYYTVNYLIL
jgi:membrane protein YqaA with SNARE-associated domain